MKEQDEYDHVLSGLCERVQGILPLAEKLAGEIAYEEKEIVKELFPRMFDLLRRVAGLSCDYVKRRTWSFCRFDTG